MPAPRYMNADNVAAQGQYIYTGLHPGSYQSGQGAGAGGGGGGGGGLGGGGSAGVGADRTASDAGRSFEYAPKFKLTVEDKRTAEEESTPDNPDKPKTPDTPDTPPLDPLPPFPPSKPPTDIVPFEKPFDPATVGTEALRKGIDTNKMMGVGGPLGDRPSTKLFQSLGMSTPGQLQIGSGGPSTRNNTRGGYDGGRKAASDWYKAESSARDEKNATRREGTRARNQWRSENPAEAARQDFDKSINRASSISMKNPDLGLFPSVSNSKIGSKTY